MTSRMSSNVETIIPPSLQSFALCRLLLPARSRRAVLLIASFIFSPSPSLSLFFPSPSPPLSSSSINSIISLLTVVCLSLPFLLTFFFFFSYRLYESVAVQQTVDCALFSCIPHCFSLLTALFSLITGLRFSFVFLIYFTCLSARCCMAHAGPLPLPRPASE